MVEKLETIKIHCNRCNHKTNHRLLFKNHTEDKEILKDYDGQPYDSIGFDYIWKLFQCCGCDDIVLEYVEWFSEWVDNQDVPSPTYYPPRVSRQKPKWFYRLTSGYQSLLNEIYTALQADSRRLAMMGARAVIDLFIHDKVGGNGTFPDKLKKLAANGFISSENKEVIDAAIDAGSASAHRAYNPPTEQMDAVMDIIESFIQHDLLKESAVSLKKSTPKRTSKP